MNIESKIIKYPSDLGDCFKVRYNVFVEEQGFDAEIELDDYDNIAYHVLVSIDKTPVATARYFNNGDYYKIGRVCVLKEYRKLKLGNLLMDTISNHLKDLGVCKCVLTSQLHAVSFYEKNGFITTGDIFLEEGCEHIKMSKDIIK